MHVAYIYTLPNKYIDWLLFQSTEVQKRSFVIDVWFFSVYF